ncbi:MAG: DNA internalization-related competence protein ComEC/Rec2 [Legionellales bacterium]|jgi:competence protein ComEC|nr:DNA internalization-related competence protein ComEC/Rec2 [Legionellales bacterium]
MWSYLFGFVCTVVFLPYSLSNLIILIIFLILVFLVPYLFSKKRALLLFLGFFSAIVVVSLDAYFYRQKIFGDSVVGHDMDVTAYIASVPYYSWPFCSFKIVTDTIDSKHLERNMRLSWFNKTSCPVVPGQKWYFKVRAKPIRGLYSLGANDSELNAYISNLHAAAYVKSKYIPHKIENAGYLFPFVRLQYYLWDCYQGLCPKCHNNDIVAALLFGLPGYLSSDKRQLFANVGVSHLLAISGLHIGMVAYLASFSFSQIWRLSGDIMLKLPAPYVGMSAAAISSCFYTAISGFGVPAIRSCIMLLMHFFVRQLGSCINLSQLLLLAAFSTAIFWPPLLWGRSFILSYAAVVLLVLSFYGRQMEQSFYYKYLHAQIFITIGLAPLIIYYWQQLPLYGFIVNIFIIPVFTFIVVPLAFSVIFLSYWTNIAAYLAQQLDGFLDLLLVSLTWVVALPYSVIEIAPQSGLFYLVLMGILFCLLLPAGLPSRNLAGILFILLPFSYSGDLLEDGQFELDILDVGQGLSVLVRTAKHNVLFDAGPAYYGGFSAGESIVWPYLKKVGIRKLSSIIISHPDLDHKGGLAAILKHVTATTGFTSVPGVFDSGIETACRRGDGWRYDGVDFKFLWPDFKEKLSKNNKSCVLKVTAKGKSVILTGDIERLGEKLLLDKSSLDELRAGVLIAPHHGSKGASSESFIAAVNPDYVVFSTAANNRFHFPHQDTIRRYDCATKRKCFNTADTGTIKIHNVGDAWSVSLFRQDYFRLWHFYGTGYTLNF